MEPAEEAVAPAPTETSDLLDLARFEDIARRILSGQNRTEICRGLKISGDTLARILAKPDMQAAFERAKRALYHEIDATMADEQAAPLVRGLALQTRAYTLLHEITEEIRKRVGEGTAKAQELKAGGDIAFGIIDRTKTDEHKRQGANINVVNLQQNNASVIADAIRESGLDLTDIVDADIVAAESDVEQEE